MRILTLILLFTLLSAPQLKAQDTINVMHYNILRYGLVCNVDLGDKTSWLKNILEYAKPDILTVNEIGKEEAYANRIKIMALTYAPMEYAPNNNQNSSSIVNRLFYNTDKFEFVRLRRIGGSLRDIDVMTLRHKPRAALGDTMELHCIVMHLKAGSSSSDQQERQTAATSVMAWINGQGPDFKNYLVMGDFNIGSASEQAWQTFAFNNNAAINLIDPTGFRNGWGSGTAQIMTQAPTSSRSDCGVGGGLDDRFDFIMISKAISAHSHRIGYVPDSYEALANDGTIYNQEINCTGNGSVPPEICRNIKQVSDHLPVVMQLQLGYPTGISRAEWPGVQMNFQKGEQGVSFQLTGSGEIESSVMDMGLIDAQGRQLWQAAGAANARTTIPMQAMAPGLYILRLQNIKGQQLVRRFIW